MYACCVFPALSSLAPLTHYVHFIIKASSLIFFLLTFLPSSITAHHQSSYFPLPICTSSHSIIHAPFSAFHHFPSPPMSPITLRPITSLLVTSRHFPTLSVPHITFPPNFHHPVYIHIVFQYLSCDQCPYSINQ